MLSRPVACDHLIMPLFFLLFMLTCLRVTACTDQWCWTQGHRYEYKIINTTMTLASAQSACESDSATLADGNSEAFTTFTSASLTNVWVGLKLVNHRVVETGNTSVVADISLWAPSESLKGDCFIFSSTGSKVQNSKCSEPHYPLCQRNGNATEWVRINSSHIEYGFFSKPATFDVAREVCQNFGGDVAYVYRNAKLQYMITSTYSLTNPQLMWTGFQWKVGAEASWINYFGGQNLLYTPSMDTSSINSGIVQCAAAFYNFSYQLHDCSTPTSFLCARFAVPPSTANTFCYDDVFDLVYRYIPEENANLTLRYQGVTAQTGMEKCSAANGNLTKFQNISRLISCFSEESVSAVMSPFQTQSPNRFWIDGATLPLTTPFTDGSLPISSLLFCFSLNGSTQKAQLVPCTDKLPAICEYSVTSQLSIDFDSTKAVAGSNCSATLTANISRPLVGNQQLKICPSSATSGLEFSCFTFEAGSQVATATLSQSTMQTATGISKGLTLTACVPSSMCTGFSLPTITVDRVNSNTVEYFDNDGQKQTQVPLTVSAAIGERQVITISVPQNSGKVQFSFALNKEVNADGCEVSPLSQTLEDQSSAQNVSAAVYCGTGNSSTKVSLFYTLKFLEGKCILSGVSGAKLLNLTFKVVKTLSVTNGSMYPFGTDSAVNVTISQAPDSFDRMEFFCVRPKSYSIGNIVADPACFYSHQSTTLMSQVLFRSTNLASLQSFSAVLEVFGPASDQYLIQQELKVFMNLTTFTVELSGLQDIEYIGAGVNINVSIPYAAPTGDSLLVALSWSLVRNTAGCGTSLDLKTTTFNSGSGIKDTVTWVPDCSVNGTMQVSLQASLARFFTYSIVGVSKLVISRPQQTELIGAPEFLFLNAPPHVMTVRLPSPLRGSFDYSLTLSLLGYETNLPFSIAPSTLYWTTSSEQSKTVAFQAMSYGFDVVVNWTKGGTANQFLIPSPLTVTVQNQSLITYNMQTRQFYFVNTTYQLYATVRVLPLGSNAMLEAFVSSSMEGKVSNVSAKFTKTSTSMQQSIQLKFLAVPSGNQLTLPLEVGNMGSYGYYPQTASIVVSNIHEQVIITADIPAFLLVGSFSGGESQKLITFRLSRAPMGSANVTLNVSHSASLSIAGSPLVWKVGEKATKTVTVTSVSVDPNATISFEVYSYTAGGKLTGEAAPISPSEAIVPVRKTTEVVFQMIPAPNGKNMVVREERSFSVSVFIDELPSPASGNLLITVGGAISAFISVSPSPMSFSATSTNRTQFFMITGAASTLGFSQDIKFHLGGTAMQQYSMTDNNIQVQVQGLLPIETNMPSDFITGQKKNVSLNVSISEVPLKQGEFSTELILNLYCPLCDGSLTFLPDVLIWQFDSPLFHTVEVFASKSLSFAPTIQGNISGNATGFKGFEKQVTVRHPSAVNINFPTDRYYAGENVSLQVNLTNPVLFPNTELNFLPLVKVNCSLCNFVPKFLQFTSLTGYLQNFILISSDNSTDFVLFEVNISVYGTAMMEYDISNATLQGSVLIRPKRWIQINHLPSVFFEGEYANIGVSIQENPDPGTQLIVEAQGTSSGKPAVWHGFANNTFAPAEKLNLSVIMRITTSELSLALFSLPDSQASRYIAPAPVPITVTQKLNVEYLNVIRGTQIIGSLNNQTLRLKLNRAPLGKAIVTPKFESAFTKMLIFVPAFLEWNSNDTDLERTVTVAGEVIGDATQVRFALQSSFSAEVGTAERWLTPSTLQIRSLLHVSFAGSSQRLYAGANLRPINITTSGTSTKPLRVGISFSIPGKIRVEPSVLYFPPFQDLQSISQKQVVKIYGIEESGTGDVIVSVLEGLEFSTIVSGSVSFAIFALIQGSLSSEGAPAVPNSTVSMRTDTIKNFELQINDIPEGGNVTYTINTVIHSNPIDPTSPRFFQLSRSSFRFGPTFGLLQQFTAISGALLPFNVTLTVISPQRDEFAPGYSVELAIIPDVTVEVTHMPSFVIAGDGNTGYFFVQPTTTLKPRETLELVAELKCDLSIATIDQSRPLLWTNALASSIRVGLLGHAPGPCEVKLRKKVVNAIDPAVSTFQVNKFNVVPAPSVALSNYSAEQTVSIPFRTYHEKMFTIYASIRNGLLKTIDVNSSALLNYTYIDPNIPQLTLDQRMSGTSVIVSSDKTTADEPVGFLHVMRLGFSSAISFSIEDGGTVAAVSIGPITPILELDGETITVIFQKYAFFNNTTPQVGNNSISFHLEPYVPSIVTESNQRIIQIAMIASQPLGLLYSPALAFQAYKTYSILNAFDCPSKNWRDKQDNLQLLQTAVPFVNISFGSKQDLGGWLAAGVLNLSACCVIFVLHFTVCLAFYIQRKQNSTRTFLQTCGRFHFPSLSFLPAFVLLQPTIEACVRVMLYSVNVSYRVYGFCVLILPVFVLPVCIHGVVVRNSSLEYEYAEPPKVKKVGKKKKKEFILFRIMRRTGQWIHPTNASYASRFGILFLDERDNFRWYLLFEYAAVVLLGAANAVEPVIKRGCMARCAALTAIMGLQFVAVVLWRPFNTWFFNGFFGLIYCLQMVVLIIVSQEMPKRIRDDKLQKGAVRLTIATAIAWDLCSLWFLVHSCLMKLRKNFKEQLALQTPGAKKEKDFGVLNVPGGELTQDREMEAKTQRLLAQHEDSDKQDDSTDDENPDIQEAIKMLDEAEEREKNPPKGIFRKGMKGNEVSFSPLRSKELKQREAVALSSPTRNIIDLQDADVKRREQKQFDWFDKGASAERDEEEAMTALPVHEARRTRFSPANYDDV